MTKMYNRSKDIYLISSCFLHIKEAAMKEKTALAPSIFPKLGLGILTLLLAGAFVPVDLIPSRVLPRKALSAPAPSSQAEAPVAAPFMDTLTRMVFVRGTTSGTASGSLAAGAAQSYVLWAYYGQTMIVSVDSGMYLEIYSRWSGISLCRLSNSYSSWQGVLPRSEDYIVKVHNSGGSTQNYTMTVTIPVRIRFARGAYSGSVWGRGSAAQTITYVLWARANQTMTASLSSSTGTVYLAIRGYSGGQSLVASSDSRTTWTGTLPQSQDYIVEAVQGGTWADFTLTVTII
jgi:hypothetical protein